MQNTFSQSGNDSKWFLIKIIFQNRYVALETPSETHPPFMANAILNFHFDYPHLSLIETTSIMVMMLMMMIPHWSSKAYDDPGLLSELGHHRHMLLI